MSSAVEAYIRATRIELKNKFPAQLYDYARDLITATEEIYGTKLKRRLTLVVASSLEMRSECVEMGGEAYLIHDEYLGQQLSLYSRFYYEIPSPDTMKAYVLQFLSLKFLRERYYNLSRVCLYGSLTLAPDMVDYLVRNKKAISSVLFQEMFIFYHEFYHFLLGYDNDLQDHFEKFRHYTRSIESFIVSKLGHIDKGGEHVRKVLNEHRTNEETFCDMLAFGGSFELASRLSGEAEVSLGLFPSAVAMVAEGVYLVRVLELAFLQACSAHEGRDNYHHEAVVNDAGIRAGIRKLFLSLMISGDIPTVKNQAHLAELSANPDLDLNTIDRTSRECFQSFPGMMNYYASLYLGMNDEQDVPGLGAFNKKFGSVVGAELRRGLLNQLRNTSL